MDVYVVTTEAGELCHAFDTREAATKWCLRTKLDRGVRALVGGIPKFRIVVMRLKGLEDL
jgi:hypothetical protein